MLIDLTRDLFCWIICDISFALSIFPAQRVWEYSQRQRFCTNSNLDLLLNFFQVQNICSTARDSVAIFIPNLVGESTWAHLPQVFIYLKNSGDPIPVKPETILRRVKLLPDHQSKLYLEFKVGATEYSNADLKPSIDYDYTLL